MTRRRWIADEVKGDRAALTGAHAAHLVRVLRARVGQEFEIATGDQVRLGLIAVISPAEDRVEFEMGEVIDSSAASNVTLILSVFKFDRMEWAIEKCTELGVTRIVPLIARRTDIHLASAAVKRVERWRRIAVQASEQSRRDSLPEIADPVKLTRQFISRVAGTKVVLAESEENLTLKEVVNSATASPFALAVGPEGGWTSDELLLFSECGWISASLGRMILRAETAAIAALAVIAS